MRQKLSILCVLTQPISTVPWRWDPIIITDSPTKMWRERKAKQFDNFTQQATGKVWMVTQAVKHQRKCSNQEHISVSYFIFPFLHVSISLIILVNDPQRVWLGKALNLLFPISSFTDFQRKSHHIQSPHSDSLGNESNREESRTEYEHMELLCGSHRILSWWSQGQPWNEMILWEWAWMKRYAVCINNECRMLPEVSVDLNEKNLSLYVHSKPTVNNIPRKWSLGP